VDVPRGPTHLVSVLERVYGWGRNAHDAAVQCVETDILGEQDNDDSTNDDDESEPHNSSLCTQR
jgi:hypothetical protein